MSSDAAAALSAIPINSILGPMILGVCINAFLYGFSVLQFVQYRTRRYQDAWPTQLLVYWTFLVDTVHTIALCWMIWTYLVDNFTNVTYLFGAPWPYTATPLFLVFTSGPIQIYFAHRIRTLSRWDSLFWTIIGLSVADTSMGIILTVFAFTHANVTDFRVLLPIVDTWLALSVVCDGVISFCLLYYLTLKQSGFRRHESFRHRAAHAFIESSILTAVVAVADLITYSIVPNTNYHILIGIPMGRVYTCTLLAMLNARLKLQEDVADGIVSKEGSYERHGEFTNAFNNLKRGTAQLRVGVPIQEQVDIVKFRNTNSTHQPKFKNEDSEPAPSEISNDVLDQKAGVVA
ncbi:hypothetical protein GSI_03870 [Ganoderma sinense ZZ0214-1]|uniref:DUF6534 domain-containing protein n=1 Tax=Ganoderma sinense ZZ0214-1 TaxID=1077348 RepID=A0A2G8SK68_9APHY|nr:hypothetical protein GSI_03870 [Ganoderma sinense ZZ0214-1]